MSILGFLFGFKAPSDGVTVLEVLPTIPPSGFTPGPQLTALRSAPATAPTAAVWADTGYVDFVADCGADPTGAADAVPALDRAYVLLSALASNPERAKSSVVLFIPPGIYTLESVPGNIVWDFAGKTTSVEIRGCGDASIFQYKNGFNFIEIANAYRIRVADLTHVGLSNDLVTTDCTFCWVLAAAEIGVLERCKFFSIHAATAVVQLQTAAWAVRDCAFDQSGHDDPTKGILYSLSCPSVQVDNCEFLDISTLNGYAFSANKANVNHTWFRHDDSFALGSGYQQRLIKITGCTFDENCVQAIWLQGGPTANVSYAHIEGCIFNPPILGLQVGCIVSDLVDVLRCESILSTGFTPTSTAPLLTVSHADRVELLKAAVNNGGSTNTIAAAATVKYLRIEDSPTLLPANILSSAKTLELQAFGTDTECECYLGLASPGVFVGALLKVTGAKTYGPLAATDGVGLAAGVALDASGTPIRVARRGQVVTMKSDGSGAIAIGDPVTNLAAAVDGQVKKAASTGTTPIVGTAVSAAAGGGGAVLFDVLFQCGEA